MFKRFFILHKESDIYDFSFPSNLNQSTPVEKPFLFPCDDFERFEHGIYVVVLTEISGSRNFIITKFINSSNLSIGFESDHPWFEIIYTIINNVIQSELYLRCNWNSLSRYLTDLMLLPRPEPGLVLYIPAADFEVLANKFVVPMKSRQKPFLVFLQSLHKQISFDDWIIIFESLLLEKWIVFHSRHLNRVTSCIFAALALIFPLDWVHLIFPCLSEQSISCLGCPSPFVAGIHSCLLDKVLPMLNPGTLIVSIDEGCLNFVSLASSSDGDNDDDHIPRSLSNFLSRSISESESKLAGLKKTDTGIEQKNAAFRLVLNGFLNTIAVLLGKYKNCTIWKPEVNRHEINKSMLAQSRGDVIQPFLTKLLQSQMVHQFLEDRLNNSITHQGQTLIFAVDHIDDFEEACEAMNRWQPDHYTEVIANMASRSRRKINDFAGKMKDIAKRNSPGTETMISLERKYLNQPLNIKNSPSSSPSTTNRKATSLETDTVRNKWITFDDNSFDRKETDLVTFDDDNVFFSNERKENEKEDGFPVIIRDFDPLYQN